MYLNVLYYAAFTLYNYKNDTTKQMAIAYTSTTIKFIFLIVVIIHHAIEVVKRRNLKRKLTTEKQPTVATISNPQHKEVTFSVVEISESPSNSPEPALHELTQAPVHAKCSTDKLNDTMQ